MAELEGHGGHGTQGPLGDCTPYGPVPSGVPWKLTGRKPPERRAVDAGGLTPLHSRTLSRPPPPRPEAEDIDTCL